MAKIQGNYDMPRDTRKTIGRLAGHLFTCPVEVYLSSEKFSDFCREHDVYDTWMEYLELSRDTPDLYGRAVTKNAFGLFLHHIFQSRPDEFLTLFIHLFLEFSEGSSCKVPVENLKKDLMDLGYSDQELESEYSGFKST